MSEPGQITELPYSPETLALLLRAIAAFTVPALPGRCGCGAPEVDGTYPDIWGVPQPVRGWCPEHLLLAVARLSFSTKAPPAR